MQNPARIECDVLYDSTASVTGLGQQVFCIYIFHFDFFFLFRVAVVFVYGTIIIVKCKYNYGSVVSREDAQFSNISGRFRTFGT